MAPRRRRRLSRAAPDIYDVLGGNAKKTVNARHTALQGTAAQAESVDAALSANREGLEDFEGRHNGRLDAAVR